MTERQEFRDAIASLCVDGINELGPSVAMAEILATVACAAQSTNHTPDEIHKAIDDYFGQLSTFLGEGQLVFPFARAPEA